MHNYVSSKLGTRAGNAYVSSWECGYSWEMGRWLGGMGRMGNN